MKFEIIFCHSIFLVQICLMLVLDQAIFYVDDILDELNTLKENWTRPGPTSLEVN